MKDEEDCSTCLVVVIIDFQVALVEVARPVRSVSYRAMSSGLGAWRLTDRSKNLRVLRAMVTFPMSGGL
jgi:hypothetical protein